MIVSDRIKHFPIMMFAIVMGLSGLTIVYQKSRFMVGFPVVDRYVIRCNRNGYFYRYCRAIRS